MTQPRLQRRPAAALTTASLLLLGAAACNASGRAVTTEGADRSAAVAARDVPPPLRLEGSAYEVAGLVPLPQVPPGNYPGLHNVFRLSDRIISGSEPHDQEALAQLAAWGVKTVISVDGKAPDVEGAAENGLTYVHIPIRYSGITEDEVLQIAKSFRELEPPFYVHCFHGKHRGPAAAAIGRVAVDGIRRDMAIAEMRQWCSTSKKYEGLYSTVATAAMPTAAETAAYDFDFTPARRFEGVRDGMIVMARVWDEIKLAEQNGWEPDPKHPDVDPLRSATILAQAFRECSTVARPDGAGDDYDEMMASGVRGAEDLVRLLTECRAEELGFDQRAQALEDAYTMASESCANCHVDYRNR